MCIEFPKWDLLQQVNVIRPRVLQEDGELDLWRQQQREISKKVVLWWMLIWISKSDNMFTMDI